MAEQKRGRHGRRNRRKQIHGENRAFRRTEDAPDTVRWEASMGNMRAFHDMLMRYGSWANYIRGRPKRGA